MQHRIYEGIGPYDGSAYIIEDDAHADGCIFVCALMRDGSVSHDWYELGCEFYDDIIAYMPHMRVIGHISTRRLHDNL